MPLNIVPKTAHNNNMADFMNFLRREKSCGEPHALHGTVYGGKISAQALRRIFDGCSDFQSRSILPGLCGERRLFVCWLDGLASGGDISQDVLRPLTEFMRSGALLTAQRLLDGAVYSSQAQRRTTLDETVGDITQGCCAVLFEDEGCAVCFELRSAQIQRSISAPAMEKSLKGGKDSFTETLRTDTALVRRRIASPALKIKSTLIGRRSRTQAAILWLDGVADPAVVAELKRRIDNINVDGALSTGVIEEYITDRPRSVFPQLLHTERPDRFARQLLNGRVGLIVDGIPIAFLVPVSFPEFLRVPQEDSQNYIVSSALSIIRWTAVLLALALPGFYTAIAMYHQEMIPTQLLLSVIASKQDVPFSTALELLGMLVAFELLQEAGLRLPDPIGDTVSIIGALIVGQSAVEAKVISPIAVIVVATAGIAGYAQPSQDLGAALRIFRFALVLAAIAAGLYGVAISLCFVVWYLCTIDSFGRSYTAPWSGGRRHNLLRTFLRRPLPEEKLREPELNTPDRRKQA